MLNLGKNIGNLWPFSLGLLSSIPPPPRPISRHEPLRSSSLGRGGGGSQSLRISFSLPGSKEAHSFSSTGWCSSIIPKVMISEGGEWGRPPYLPEVSILCRANIYLAKAVHLHRGHQWGFKLTQHSWPTLRCAFAHWEAQTSSMESARQGNHENPGCTCLAIQDTSDNGCLTRPKGLRTTLSNHWLTTKIQENEP